MGQKLVRNPDGTRLAQHLVATVHDSAWLERYHASHVLEIGIGREDRRAQPSGECDHERVCCAGGHAGGHAGGSARSVECGRFKMVANEGGLDGLAFGAVAARLLDLNQKFGIDIEVGSHASNPHKLWCEVNTRHITARPTFHSQSVTRQRPSLKARHSILGQSKHHLPVLDRRKLDTLQGEIEFRIAGAFADQTFVALRGHLLSRK